MAEIGQNYTQIHEIRYTKDSERLTLLICVSGNNFSSIGIIVTSQMKFKVDNSNYNSNTQCQEWVAHMHGLNSHW